MAGVDQRPCNMRTGEPLNVSSSSNPNTNLVGGLQWGGWVTTSTGSSFVVNNGGSGLNGDVADPSGLSFILTQDSGTPTIVQMALSFA